VSERRRYIRPPGRWWLRREYFARYTLRELTSVFVLLYALVLLAGLAALSHGAGAYAAYRAALESPVSIALHVAVLIAALYNSITWFQVAPKAMPPVFLGTRPLSDRLIRLGHYVLFLLLSGLLVLFFSAG